MSTPCEELCFTQLVHARSKESKLISRVHSDAAHAPSAAAHGCWFKENSGSHVPWPREVLTEQDRLGAVPHRAEAHRLSVQGAPLRGADGHQHRQPTCKGRDPKGAPGPVVRAMPPPGAPRALTGCAWGDGCPPLGIPCGVTTPASGPFPIAGEGTPGGRLGRGGPGGETKAGGRGTTFARG